MKLPDVQGATSNRAGWSIILLACMEVGGVIGFAQGALFAAFLKETAWWYCLFIAVQAAVVGFIVGGVWGFLLIMTFFRRTLTNRAFYGVAVVSLLAGLLSAVYLHFIVRDAEPISVFVILAVSLAAACAIRTHQFVGNSLSPAK